MSKLYVNEIHPKTAGGTVTTKSKESFVLLGYELNPSAYTTLSAGDNFPFNQVAQSKGTGASDWNNTTKEYTAPCNGIYSWHIASITNAATNTTDWRLYVDGSLYYIASWQSGGRGYNGSGQVYLNQGQTLTWIANGATTKAYGNVGGVGGPSYTSGSVALIREIV